MKVSSESSSEIDDQRMYVLWPPCDQIWAIPDVLTVRWIWTSKYFSISVNVKCVHVKLFCELYSVILLTWASLQAQGAKWGEMFGITWKQELIFHKINELKCRAALEVLVGEIAATADSRCLQSLQARLIQNM